MSKSILTELKEELQQLQNGNTQHLPFWITAEQAVQIVKQQIKELELEEAQKTLQELQQGSVTLPHWLSNEEAIEYAEREIQKLLANVSENKWGKNAQNYST